MTALENVVADHYAVSDLTKNILHGLEIAGADLDRLTIDDLSPIDEFHIGGRPATEYAIAQMNLSGVEYVLDVGSGIGGTARTLAKMTGCRVAGIDLTPDYVETAKVLSRYTGLAEQTEFQVASALSLPFDAASFDAAISIHVAMNIPDRPALYRELARVLKPGSVLCLYDVMKKNDQPLDFPVPWANTAEYSHLVTPDEMVPLLAKAGFEVSAIEDRTEFAYAYFDRRIAAVTGKPDPLGPHLIMGASAKAKFKNIRHNLDCGRIAPILLTARLS